MKLTKTFSAKSFIHLVNHRIGPAILAASVAAVALGLLGAASVQAQTLTDNFNDQTDSGSQGTGCTTTWATGLVTTRAAHSCTGVRPSPSLRTPSDPLATTPTGYKRRLPARTPMVSGLPGGGSLLEQYYTNRFLMAADLVSWTNPPNFYQYIGFLCLVPPGGPCARIHQWLCRNSSGRTRR